jgi:hypothetical protein
MYGEGHRDVLSQRAPLLLASLPVSGAGGEAFRAHDTEAREVDNFVAYYRLNNGGGTNGASAYKLINRLIEKFNLAADYNLYVFRAPTATIGIPRARRRFRNC